MEKMGQIGQVRWDHEVYVLGCVCIPNHSDVCQQMTVIRNLLVPAELWKIYTHRFLNRAYLDYMRMPSIFGWKGTE